MSAKIRGAAFRRLGVIRGSKRRFLPGLCAFMAFVVLTTSATAQDTPTPITIALSSNALPYGGLFIAEKAGLFAKHGLQPKLIVMDSGNAAMTA